MRGNWALARAGRRNARNVKEVTSIELHRIKTLLLTVTVAMGKNNEQGEANENMYPD
jgi:hypothetical protein